MSINGNKQVNNKSLLQHWQIVTLCLAAYDGAAVALSYFMALLLRFDLHFSRIPEEYFTPFLKFIPFYVIICIAVFGWLRLYRSIWRFASYNELLRMIQATIATGALHILLITLLLKRMPISYFMMGITLQFVLTIGIRFSYRLILLLRAEKFGTDRHTARVMVIGDGLIIGTT